MPEQGASGSDILKEAQAKAVTDAGPGGRRFKINRGRENIDPRVFMIWGPNFKRQMACNLDDLNERIR